MANHTAHAAVGAVTTSGLWLTHCKKTGRRGTLMEMTVVSAAGAFCGVLADILEPATHPRHRAFFHSWTFALLLVLTMSAISKHPDCSKGLKNFTQMLCAAYGSHLLLDCFTPLGLPI